MINSINENLTLDKIKTSLKQIPLITEVFKNEKGQLIFTLTNKEQVIINLEEVVKSY